MPPSSSSPSPTSFPIVAIAIVGILGTAAFLLSYYILVIKCCLDVRREESDGILRRLSRSGRFLQRHLAALDPAERQRGLDPRAIRAIPTFRHSPPPAADCPVCLVEFRGGERLRRLPGCGHAFHIDCIDTWLESSASCPLCRAEVEEKAAAIEIGETAGRARAGRAGSKGDECVGVRRDKDESFVVQPMRRSVSLDSSGDEKLSEAARGQRLFAALSGWRTSRSLRRAVQPVEILEV